jgi:tetratricopeptide (TPR) repeat protein
MRRSLALTALLALATAANLFAVGEARLNGKVMDAATKAGIPDATIVLTASKGAGHSFNQEYKVDKDGNYAIFVLDGTIKYDMVFAAPGHQAESYKEVKLKLGEPNKRDVELKALGAAAPADAKAAPADPAVAAFNEGAHLANEGKIDEAIAKMEEAVKAKPELIAGHEALATLYHRKKDYPKAIAAANKVLEYDADNTDMAGILYDSYTATGDKVKAAEFKNKMPANPTVLFNDAAKLINSQKDGEAEPLLKQAIQADEKFAPAYYELGMIYVRAGKNAEARTNLQKYLDLAPNGRDAATAKEMLSYVK